jgi:hypothetical protein
MQKNMENILKNKFNFSIQFFLKKDLYFSFLFFNQAFAIKIPLISIYNKDKIIFLQN